MKNKMFLICAFVYALLCLSACEAFEHIIDEPEDRITVFNDDHKNLAFSPGESSVDINVISNIPWTASSVEDWYDVDPMSAPSGNTKVTVSVAENMTSEARNSEITFTAGKAVLVINISQTGVKALTFTVTHKADIFHMPLFSGVYDGFVNWGDGSVDEIDVAEVHDYKVSGEKTVSFELMGERNDIQIEMNGIKDVIRIDISGLRK